MHGVTEQEFEFPQGGAGGAGRSVGVVAIFGGHREGVGVQRGVERAEFTVDTLKRGKRVRGLLLDAGIACALFIVDRALPEAVEKRAVVLDDMPHVAADGGGKHLRGAPVERRGVERAEQGDFLADNTAVGFDSGGDHAAENTGYLFRTPGQLTSAMRMWPAVSCSQVFCTLAE